MSLSRSEALHWFQEQDLLALGRASEAVRYALNPDPVVTYIVDRNINYTNVCVADCGFCAFYRSEGHPEAYVLPEDVLLGKVQETVDMGGTGILLQGGHHPSLPFSFYENMLSSLTSHFPKIHLHAFSAPEIIFFSRLYQMPISTVLSRLQKVGLQSIPGGGAEILSPAVRKKMAPGKATVDAWLDVHRQAHQMGMFSTATMMFGSVESFEDILDHLEVIGTLQAETGGFTAFIPWTYQKGSSTPLPQASLTGEDYLRMLALSRLFLDNITHFQSSWVTQGLKIGQMALYFGADDMGSIMIEENVVSSAGCSFHTSEAQLRHVISETGLMPIKRNTAYQWLETPSPSKSSPIKATSRHHISSLATDFSCDST